MSFLAASTSAASIAIFALRESSSDSCLRADSRQAYFAARVAARSKAEPALSPFHHSSNSWTLSWGIVNPPSLVERPTNLMRGYLLFLVGDVEVPIHLKFLGFQP